MLPQDSQFWTNSAQKLAQAKSWRQNRRAKRPTSSKKIQKHRYERQVKHGLKWTKASKNREYQSQRPKNWGLKSDHRWRRRRRCLHPWNKHLRWSQFNRWIKYNRRRRFHQTSSTAGLKGGRRWRTREVRIDRTSMSQRTTTLQQCSRIKATEGASSPKADFRPGPSPLTRVDISWKLPKAHHLWWRIRYIRRT